MLETSLTLLGTLMIAATLLPLARLDDWWIRVFDFPRLQVATISALLLLLMLLVSDEPGPARTLWMAALAACAAYQAYRMHPYTRLHAKQVQDSRHADPASRDRNPRLLPGPSGTQRSSRARSTS